MSDQSSGGSVWSARPIPPLRDLLPSSKRRGKPWAEELMAYWADRFGNVAERNAMVRFVAASLADSTAEKYGHNFARFVRWCGSQPDQPSPLPATRDTVMRWIASDVCPPADIARVKVDNLRPYTAAINTVHRDFELPEPADGHLWRAFKRGLQREQQRLPGRK